VVFRDRLRIACRALFRLLGLHHDVARPDRSDGRDRGHECDQCRYRPCFRWGEEGAIVMLAAGVVYVVGMFVVTMVFNVPLNDALAAVDPAASSAAPLWARYLQDWTFWNHVRTIASSGAAILFTVAIAAR
jgi:hypothetical protein